MTEEVDYGDRTCYTIDGNNDGIAECYYFDETGHLWLDVFSPTPDGYFICLDGYAWAIDDIKQIQVIDEQIAQSIKTKLPYESPAALSLEEVIKDNSEYYGRYEGLLPGKVYAYENHRSYDDLFVDSLVSISLKSEMNNHQAIYWFLDTIKNNSKEDF